MFLGVLETVMDYRVDLEVFRGPLDLLLFLVRKNELDILDIPIAQITEQYFEYLQLLHMIDVDVAGDFLVMATTLMEIKSRMLLPRVEEDGEAEDDPRQELVRQLLEYKKFRDAAEQLEELAEQQRTRFVRRPSDHSRPGVDPATEPIRDVELWDLVSAFGRLMRQTLALAPSNIVYDDVPVHLQMDQILTRLGAKGRVEFSALFKGPQDRAHLVSTFLAVLELVKTGQVHAEQPEPFGEIWIWPADAEASQGADTTTA